MFRGLQHSRSLFVLFPCSLILGLMLTSPAGRVPLKRDRTCGARPGFLRKLGANPNRLPMIKDKVHGSSIDAKATAVWLVDNTTLSFDQIAEFCGIHPLEVQGIADGDLHTNIVVSTRPRTIPWTCRNRAVIRKIRKHAKIRAAPTRPQARTKVRATPVTPQRKTRRNRLAHQASPLLKDAQIGKAH